MAEESNHFESWIARASCLDPKDARFLPDFLIISPPKTGSTWLAANLRCHPRIFIPAIKELKYFSTYYRWLDLNWYARHFQPAGDRLKGEASPSYSVLPRRMIQSLRELIPEVKLIFLMRDPVARAWSHARHNWHHREANFRRRVGTFDTVADEEWRENFRHPWPLASGDYLGQLRRWLSVFPRRQIFVEFFERIQTDPVGLLTGIMEFLGVAPPEDWSPYPTRETILPGAAKTMSNGLRDDLRLLLEERTRELGAILKEKFGLCIGDKWVETLTANGRPADGDTSHMAPTNFFADDLENARLETLLLENDSAGPRVMEKEYHGYKIVLHRGRFIALALTLGEVDVANLDEAEGAARGDILVTDSLEGAKEAVLHRVIRDLRRELASMQAGHEKLSNQLRECSRIISTLRDSLAAQQNEQARQLADCQAFLGRVRNSLLFRARRRLARIFAQKRPI